VTRSPGSDSVLSPLELTVPEIVPVLVRLGAAGRNRRTCKFSWIRPQATQRGTSNCSHNPKVEGSNPSPATS
jgi:hypothetical protein